MTSPSSYLYSTGSYATPFTQMYLRPKLVRSQLGFARIDLRRLMGWIVGSGCLVVLVGLLTRYDEGGLHFDGVGRGVCPVAGNQRLDLGDH